MRTLFIFNHPYDGSFCNALLDAAIQGVERAGGEFDLIHLDKDGFNPIMSSGDLKAFSVARSNPLETLQSLDNKVLDYKKRLEKAHHLVFIFPIWWMLMPALTKGFIDRVIFPEVAYTYSSDGSMHSSLKNLGHVTVITTMGGPASVYDTLMSNAVWKAIKYGTFGVIGINQCKWMNFDQVAKVSVDKRSHWLKDVEEYFANM